MPIDTVAADSGDLVEARQNWLLEQVAERRELLTNDAATRLGVSVDTVRRDLRALHDRGLLVRVHGGAVPASPLSPSYAGRSQDPSPGRAALASAVVKRFRSGDVIGLDAGNTTAEIAARIPESLHVVVVTNSPVAAVALTDHPSAEVVLLGGTVDVTWMAATGPETVDGWRNHRLDLAVVGVCSFDAETGASTRSRLEVPTKRALVAAAAETIVPVQVEKLETQSPFPVVGLDEVDTLIVQADTSKQVVGRFRRAGVDVLVAP